MTTPKKCSHGIDLLPHAECLDCDLLWHQRAMEADLTSLLRHHEEVKRIRERRAARQQQEGGSAPE